MTAAIATVRHTARGCLASARLDLLIVAQYRVSTSIWALVSLLGGIVSLAVWQAVAAANDGSTNGFDQRDFAGYFLVMVLVQDLVTTGFAHQVPDRIRNGKLATLMLRPLHPLAHLYGLDVGFTTQTFLVKLPLVAALVLVFDARIDPTAGAIAMSSLVLPLAMLTRALAEAILACVSMWVVRIDGIRGGFMLVALLLGGQFAPLAVLPEWLASIARALPFYWSLGYPVELLQGSAPASDAWIGISVLAAWSAALFALLQPVWRAGTRAFEAVGQ